MNAWVQRIRASGFARSVGLLMGGTVLAHAITVLAMLFVTRLYDPQDFSVLAVFSGIVLVVGSIACLRLDVVVPLPESDADAANALVAALGFALLASLLLALPLLLFPARIADAVGQPALAPYLWLVPFGTWLFGSQSALQLWSVRRKAFRDMAISRVTQAGASSGAQLALGWAGAGPIGLLLGQVVNSASGCLALGARALRQDGALLREVRAATMRRVLHTYRRYPRYSTLEQLCNGAALHLPIILISALAAGPEAGYLNLAMYAMQAPLSLIGSAVSQVYLARAPEEHREGRLAPFTAAVFGSLLKSGVGPLLFGGIVAPVLFAVVFGAQWERSGDLVAWMTPWFVAQFLASPLSMALYVVDRPLTALVLQVIGMIVRVVAVLLAAQWAPERIAEVYCLSGLAYYGAFLVAVLWAVRVPAAAVVGELRRALPWLAGWAAAGLLAALAGARIVAWLS